MSGVPRPCLRLKATPPSPRLVRGWWTPRCRRNPCTFVRPPSGPGRSSFCPGSRTGAAAGRRIPYPMVHGMKKSDEAGVPMKAALAGLTEAYPTRRGGTRCRQAWLLPAMPCRPAAPLTRRAIEGFRRTDTAATPAGGEGPPPLLARRWNNTAVSQSSGSSRPTAAAPLLESPRISPCSSSTGCLREGARSLCCC